ncbi:MAG: phage portal protein [Methanobrevibacter sp.]|nr:phage portal protein [Methanobrevibacter sp.]
MGWLNKLFSKAKPKKNAQYNLNVSMKGYQPVFTAFGSNILYSDIVYSALMMKARFFGKLEPKHIRIRENKTELVTDSSVARLLRQPNDFQTMYDFLAQAYFMREKDGNCFIYADYYISNANQRIYTGLYILLPSMQPIIQQDDSGKLFIRFQFVNPAREVLFPLEDIIIWKQNMEDNQFVGGGRFSGMANADLLNSLQAYQTSKEAVAEAAKLGCMIDGIIKINGYAADDEKIQQIRNDFINDLQTNKTGIGVLDNGAEYLNIQRSLKMVDSATLKEIKENVLLHTGVSIEMLEGKFNETDKEAFYENWIEPAAVSLAQAMSKVFFSQWQTSYGDRVELYPMKIQLMSTSEITKVVQATIAAGVFTLDEYREMYGYAPLPNGEGLARPRGYNNLDNEFGGGTDEGKTNEGNQA